MLGRELIMPLVRAAGVMMLAKLGVRHRMKEKDTKKVCERESKRDTERMCERQM